MRLLTSCAVFDRGQSLGHETCELRVGQRFPLRRDRTQAALLHAALERKPAMREPRIVNANAWSRRAVAAVNSRATLRLIAQSPLHTGRLHLPDAPQFVAAIPELAILHSYGARLGILNCPPVMLRV